jgi:hypothetical protein
MTSHATCSQRGLFQKILTILFISGLALAHAAEPYQKSDLSIETRVEDLLGRMTLEEKIGQLRGGIAKSVDDAVKMVVEDHYGFVVFSEIRAGGRGEAAEVARRFLTQVRRKSHLKIEPVLVSCGAHGKSVPALVAGNAVKMLARFANPRRSQQPQSSFERNHPS